MGEVAQCRRCPTGKERVEMSIENTRCVIHYRGGAFRKLRIHISMKHHQIWKLNEHHHLQKVFLKEYGRIAVNVWILRPEELGGFNY